MAHPFKINLLAADSFASTRCARASKAVSGQVWIYRSNVTL